MVFRYSTWSLSSKWIRYFVHLGATACWARWNITVRVWWLISALSASHISPLITLKQLCQSRWSKTTNDAQQPKSSAMADGACFYLLYTTMIEIVKRILLLYELFFSSRLSFAPKSIKVKSNELRNITVLKSEAANLSTHLSCYLQMAAELMNWRRCFYTGESSCAQQILSEFIMDKCFGFNPIKCSLLTGECQSKNYYYFHFKHYNVIAAHLI